MAVPRRSKRQRHTKSEETVQNETTVALIAQLIQRMLPHPVLQCGLDIPLNTNNIANSLNPNNLNLNNFNLNLNNLNLNNDLNLNNLTNGLHMPDASLPYNLFQPIAPGFGTNTALAIANLNASGLGSATSDISRSTPLGLFNGTVPLPNSLTF